MMKQLLFRLAKSPGMGRLVGWSFRWCSWFLPVKKMYCSEKVLAFEHPRPAYADHIILSPRAAVSDLLALGEEKNCGYLLEIWWAVETLAATRLEYRQGFTVAANGGKRQEVGQVHFHLFTGHPLVSKDPAAGQEGPVLFTDAAVCIRRHPSPEWALHFVVQPAIAAVEKSRTGARAPMSEAYLQAIPKAISQLQDRYVLAEKGYSLVYRQSSNSPAALPTFHLIAGPQNAKPEQRQ